MVTDVREQLVQLLPRLRRFGYALTGSLEDADELVQVACEKALISLHNFQPDTRLDSWMFRIMQNAFIDGMRQARRRPTTSDPDVLGALEFDARIEQRTEAREDLATIRSTVASLPEEQRVVLALVALEGRSYQEVADILGVPIGTVMSRLSRARRKLAESIASGSSAQRASKT